MSWLSLCLSVSLSLSFLCLSPSLILGEVLMGGLLFTAGHFIM